MRPWGNIALVLTKTVTLFGFYETDYDGQRPKLFVIYYKRKSLNENKTHDLSTYEALGYPVYIQSIYSNEYDKVWHVESGR